MLYEITPDESRAIIKRYERHAPVGDSQERHGLVMKAVIELARTLHTVCPRSRELDKALDYLETSQWSANAAIARNEQA